MSLQHPLLDAATNAIQHTIFQEHRHHFHQHASASLLLDELHRLSSGNASGNRSTVVSGRKFALFIRAFAPYFDVLGTCVKLRSEWIGGFWGLIHLIFKISSDYALLLEKIADTFEAVAQIIPPYQQIYEVCKRNTSDPNVDAEGLRLAALMSYVYADLVQLCLELYQIFCRGFQGPETHYLTLPTLWRPLDSRLVHLETRISQHKKWLQKETESQVQQYADVSLYRKDYLGFLQRYSEVKANGHVDHEDQRIAKRLRRVAKVQAWLSSSGMGNARDGNQQLHTNSSDWFLHTDAYSRWRDKPFESTEANNSDALLGNWQHRVLFVQDYNLTLSGRESCCSSGRP
ncbi:hypothetical protein GMOD_00005227 [Pyrenophora seminiperda CCB06]|uniref:Uncharacterized protein n=1 Tax=Pyrenophora seminiperda CCB06 TaxID=1302712 RepID=A0A3M7LV89_9PLEO|nr:hypothetical protein GMOD_00005227 [Pyrenophora seminiperda CCB06]